MPMQAGKAAAFQALHRRPETFVIANPWDAGTARILTALGFQGALHHQRRPRLHPWPSATPPEASPAIKLSPTPAPSSTPPHLPVAADLENGYGHSPEAAAETIRLAAEAGLVGGSIEDATGDPANPIYGFHHAVERIARRQRPRLARCRFPFMLVARAENLPPRPSRPRRHHPPPPGLRGRRRRSPLRARHHASATTSAPSAPRSSKPVNVLMGIKGAPPLSVTPNLGALGVRRISIGSGFARAALTAFLHAAREVRDHGTFTFAEEHPLHVRTWSNLFEPHGSKSRAHGEAARQPGVQAGPAKSTSFVSTVPAVRPGADW
jgi:2-methylisocitrate lyase-like PEP mutase family enzyme